MKVKSLNVYKDIPQWEKEIKQELTKEGYTYYGNKMKQMKRSKVNYIKVQCDKKHPPYWVQLGNFRNGARCKECMKERFADERVLDYIKVKDYIESQGYTLLSKEYTGSKEHMDIQCPKGHKYSASWVMFRHNKNRCPRCKSSKGENVIRYILDNHEIEYKEQYHTYIGKDRHVFDFYIPKEGKYIEHQGEQHFMTDESIRWLGKDRIEEQIYRDEDKRLYCQEALLETTYKDTLNDIKEKIEEHLNLYPKPMKLKEAEQYNKHIDISEVERFYKWNTSEDTMEKFGISGRYLYGITKGKNLKIKPVKQIENGEVITIYDTQKEVEERLGIQINGALKGRVKQAGGFEWEYVTQEEYENYQKNNEKKEEN